MTQRADQTSRVLREIALAHFQRDGVAGADVAAIAAEAGVSERTFYRHFATKDEVLFGDVTTSLEWLTAILRGRPEDEDIIDGLLLALQSTPRPRATIDLGQLRASLLSRERVERWLRDLQGQLCHELEKLLAARGHGTLEARLQAQLLSGATFAGLTVWMDAGNQDLTRLVTTVTQALDRLRPIIGTPPPSRRKRPRRPATRSTTRHGET
jgi:AcrR family transcriptional regulator